MKSPPPQPLGNPLVRTTEASGSPIYAALKIETGRVLLDLGGPPEANVLLVEIGGRLVFRHLHDCRVLAGNN